MQTDEIPASSPVVVTANVSLLAVALDRIFGQETQKRFFYFQPVGGTSQSERLISTESRPDGMIRMGLTPLTTRDVANELLGLSAPDALPPARYNPPDAPTGMLPGWEIRVMCIQKHQVAHARAAWVHKE